MTDALRWQITVEITCDPAFVIDGFEPRELIQDEPASSDNRDVLRRVLRALDGWPYAHNDVRVRCSYGPPRALVRRLQGEGDGS